MTALQIKELTTGDEARWDAFVMACPEATFFHRAGWKRVIETVFRHPCHFLYAERAGEIVGVLPLAQVKSLLFGNALVSLPFCVYGGVASSEPAAGAALEQHAIELAQAQRSEHLELRNLRQRHLDWPRQDLYVTFRKALLAEVEANLAAIPRKQRAMVRKGMKNGLTSRNGQDIDDFFELYADNVHRHGTPALPKGYFQTLAQVFGADCSTLIVTANNGAAVSGVLSFRFHDELLPYYAGDTPAARDLAANDFKYWELMRTAVEAGCRTFDYGRSKRGTGSYDFKKNWGFVPAPLSYEYRLLRRDAIPQNNPSNPKYQAFIAAWRRLPRPVVNRLGPLIVRSLG